MSKSFYWTRQPRVANDEAVRLCVDERLFPEKCLDQIADGDHAQQYLVVIKHREMPENV
jgi:hypothetical protein